MASRHKSYADRRDVVADGKTLRAEQVSLLDPEMKERERKAKTMEII